MEEEFHLKYSMKGLYYIGMYPLKLNYDSTVRKVLYKAYHYFVLIYSVVFVFTQYIEATIQLSKDIFEVFNVLCVSLLYATSIVKLLTVRSKRMVRLVRQLKETEGIILSDEDDEMKKIYKQYVDKNWQLCRFLYGLGWATVIPFFVTPVAEYYIHTYNDQGNQTYHMRLPLGSWFPFDARAHYHEAFFLQAIAGFYGAFITVITDISFWGCMIFIRGQLHILQYKLQNFKEHSKVYMERNGLSDENRARFIMVKKCAMLHKIIIEFNTELNASMNRLMLLDFIICSVQIGICGMRVVIVGEIGVELVANVEYLLAMMTQMLLFYWNANEVALESEFIAIAIFDSDWTDCSDDLKKMLNFIAFRSQSPLMLFIGPFYPMSTATAISMLRASYSYVALMRQIYK